MLDSEHADVVTHGGAGPRGRAGSATRVRRAMAGRDTARRRRPPGAPRHGSRIGSFGVVLLLLAELTAPAPADAITANPPATVSPGGIDTLQEVAHPCPTFLWGAAAPAPAGDLELVVYELPVVREHVEVGSLDPAAQLEPVLSVLLPRSAPGWTPPLDRCLVPGGEYAWAVRVVASDDDSEASSWSPVRVFRVARMPSIASASSDADSERLGDVEPSRRSGSRVPPDGGPGEARRTERAVRPASSVPRLPKRAAGERLVTAAAAPNPASAPVSLRLSRSLELGLSSAVLQDGAVLMWNDETNQTLGRNALASNTTGTWNIAVGVGALRLNETGIGNVAVGYEALGGNTSEAANVAIGRRALLFTHGSGNTAIGHQAMYFTSSGNNNIAIGAGAGAELDSGSDNIMIGNPGGDSSPFDSRHHTILIGTANVHETAFIAGNLGLGTYAPSNRLHVVDSSSASSLAGHVAQIENSSDGANADVLALKVGRTDDPGVGNNFITFYNGDDVILGECQGNGAGGVVCVSSGADYAEFMPRLDPTETLGPGDVVGLFAGGVTRRISGAQRVMVISTAPLMLGNDPGKVRRDDYAPVALVGQVEVRVRGPARAGDLLLASDLEDGTAVAVPVAELVPSRLDRVVGRALADHSGDGEATVRALVGLPDNSLLAALLETYERRLAGLERALARSPPADATHR